MNKMNKPCYQRWQEEDVEIRQLAKNYAEQYAKKFGLFANGDQ